MKALTIIFFASAALAVAAFVFATSRKVPTPAHIEATVAGDVALVQQNEPATGFVTNEVTRELPIRARVHEVHMMPEQPAVLVSRDVQPTREMMPRRSGRDDAYTAARERMVEEQLASPTRGITNPNVLQAMKTVLRHSFVPAELLADAYADVTINIGYGRTIETPFVVASIAEQLDARPSDRILEVGLGSGYEAAIFSLLVKEVYATDDSSIMARRAEVDLQRVGCTNNLFIRNAQQTQGWSEAAPFDTIVFNGSLDQVSENLISQLKPGGRFIIPVGEDGNLHVLAKYGSQLVRLSSRPVRPTPIAGNQVTMPPVMKATRVGTPQ